MKKILRFLPASMLILIISCGPKINYCELSEIDNALKSILIKDMEDWKKNASYSGIENFEKKVNDVVSSLEIVETNYKGSNNSIVSEMYLESNVGETSSCLCTSKVRIEDHKAYKEAIEGPVAKVRKEEHPLNSAYLRMKRQMNYLDNDGYVFSYVVIKKDDEPIEIIQFYPDTRQPNIDNAGALIFEYLKYLEEN